MSRTAAAYLVIVATACTKQAAAPLGIVPSEWMLLDNFEGTETLQGWTNVDTQNDTDPFVEQPQIAVIRREQGTGNHFMLRKPAADGVVGNRKAIGLRPLPAVIDVGETGTLYTRINIEYFPNNHSFGLSNTGVDDIVVQGYDALEPMIRVTDKAESDGFKNDGTLTVLDGYKSYSKVNNPSTGVAAQPLEPGTWYEIWAVINNAKLKAGGQSYDVYVRGGEFAVQQRVFTGAVFRMQRVLPLTHFMAISNTGPVKAPYGNGGVRYDDIYLARGEVLSSPSTKK